MRTEQEINDELNTLVEMGLNNEFGLPWGRDHYAATWVMRALQWVAPQGGESVPPVSQVLKHK